MPQNIVKKIGIIDADLIGRKKHRFPNLASMKISGYHKDQGDDVHLITSYDELHNTNSNIYIYIYISKVFTDTEVPEWVLNLPNVSYGGTGFFYDKAPRLPDCIEHHFPDYHLYDDWVNEQLENGGKKSDFKYYLDYSIGFLTRGCFRQCEFCVNRNYKRAEIHSGLSEFYDPDRKKICLLDDNFLSHPKWKEMLLELQSLKKPFQFKQGLDERLLTQEKCEILFNSKYDGDYIFAFDNIADYDIIEEKLKLIRQYTNVIPKFYLFCGFDRKDIWDQEFWYHDIVDIFQRIRLLIKYKCIPYIMRYNRYEESPHRGIYITLARWCNQPSIFKKKSFREFCSLRSDSQRYLETFLRNTDFENEYGDFLTMKFFNIK